jgi:8-oxo-dGTP diphosphatase
MAKRRSRKKAAEPGANPGVKVKHQRHKSAGVIVFRKEGDACLFLLVLSRLTKRPLWEFPKGGVERGETLSQAALRELIEETGISEAEVRILPDFQRTEDYRFTAGDSGQRTLIHKQVTYYLGETEKQAVTLSVKESSEFAWVPLPEAMKRVRYAKRKRLLLDAAIAIGCAKAEDYPDITSRKR